MSPAPGLEGISGPDALFNGAERLVAVVLDHPGGR